MFSAYARQRNFVKFLFKQNITFLISFEYIEIIYEKRKP